MKPYETVMAMGEWPLVDAEFLAGDIPGLERLESFVLEGTFLPEDPTLTYKVSVGQPKRLPRKIKKALKNAARMTGREHRRVLRIRWPIASMTPVKEQ